MSLIGQYNQMVILTLNQLTSPELLIRRMSAPKEIAQRRIALKNFGQMIDKNSDNAEEIKYLIKMLNRLQLRCN